MNCFVTGGAGFIGSNLVDKLISLGSKVTIFDNFSTGKKDFVNESAVCHIGNILQYDWMQECMKGNDIVFHFAAHADVRYGVDYPEVDLYENTIGTSNVLKAMKENGIDKIVFPSTGSIYGENIIPTPENAPMPIQTSFYGASKLAGEGLIQAYCEAYGFKCWIYRFVSILGERYTHGHVYDFYMQLKEHPDKLFVLGNGEQRKSYLYVKDCVDGILWGMDWANDRINIFNLGKDFTFSVDDSIDVITSYLGVNPEIEYSSNENKGWVGDIPHILLDCTKIKNLGWIPEVNITKSIQKTLDWLKGNR